MAQEEVLIAPHLVAGFELDREDHMAQGEDTCTGQPWWIAVYVPRRTGTSVSDLFKITRVHRFQESSEHIAAVVANRLAKDWRLVSLAREVQAVY